MLRSLEVSFDGVRDLALRIVGIGETTTKDAPPFTARARRVLESALGEGQDLGSAEIGSEHMVLALVKETEGVAARILLDFGATAAAIGTAVGRLRPAPRRSRPEDEIPREHDPLGIGDPDFEGRVDFGWRGHAIVLAAVGAATLTRAAFAPTRTGGLSELEMKLLAYLTLQASDQHSGQRGTSIEPLHVALVCDPDELDELVQALVDRSLLAYDVDDSDDTRIAVTHAGVVAVQDWLRLVTLLFGGWPPSYEGVDDATG